MGIFYHNPHKKHTPPKLGGGLLQQPIGWHDDIKPMLGLNSLTPWHYSDKILSNEDDEATAA